MAGSKTLLIECSKFDATVVAEDVLNFPPVIVRIDDGLTELPGYSAWSMLDKLRFTSELEIRGIYWEVVKG